jgi:hypothetical protein
MTQSCIYNPETTIVTSQEREKYVLFFDFKPMSGIELEILIKTIHNIGKKETLLPNRY